MNTVEETPSVSETISGSPHESEPCFFSVSITKLVVLSLCSLGLYELYWFYKNWQLVKNHERSDISPFWRAIFANFFCYALFRRVKESAVGPDAATVLAGPLAVGWIITDMLWKLPDPYWLSCLLAFLFLIPIQVAANRVNRRHIPTSMPDNRFDGWNIVTVVAGGIVIVFAVVGTFVPQQ